MNKFFVSTPLGYELTTLAEMKECWPYLLGKDSKTHSLPFPEVEVLQGGLEFETELFAALQFNFFLKTANRVLLRMTSFRTKDLPKFYQKFKALPWKEYLAHGHVEWEVAAQKSRLNNEKRLQESAEKALSELFPKTEAKDFAGSIYIRMEEDLCTISLDATGEHLHKRGWSVLKGEAPLRETIAAYLLKEMIGEATPAEIREVTLLDPMMGAGTFLTEARSLWQGQFKRPFAFQKWKKAPKLFLSETFVFNYELPSSNMFKAFVGFDIEEKMLKVVSENFKEVERQIQFQEKADFKSTPLEVLHKNSMDTTWTGARPLWMVVNPPYGERLSSEGLGGLKGLAEAFCTNFKPQALGILFPDKERLQKAPIGYKVEKELKINNGGLRCLFTILTPL
ncbi:class I SAM-dependent RNA methyltransferase [Bdellovibrio sp. NC01]|uniref:THUMP domain-containing class I SAM-dependent RNA methyltransferase n=1 Tax=Bdellovibrio sp. NC01 TaxID=2220073 RepID=UPI00115BC2B9|nr:RNA methyltransferase [Bdellovibrio sp. NC01]QDK38247.1 RNA methyltransferase [Bdellovibrio sp. NC01]